MVVSSSTYYRIATIALCEAMMLQTRWMTKTAALLPIMMMMRSSQRIQQRRRRMRREGEELLIDSTKNMNDSKSQHLGWPNPLYVAPRIF